MPKLLKRRDCSWTMMRFGDVVRLRTIGIGMMIVSDGVSQVRDMF